MQRQYLQFAKKIGADLADRALGYDDHQPAFQGKGDCAGDVNPEVKATACG